MEGVVSQESIRQLIQDYKDDKFEREVITFHDKDGFAIVKKDNYKQFSGAKSADTAIFYYNERHPYE